MIWTVTATAQMAALNLLTYLTAYLDECGRNAESRSAGRRWNGSCPGRPAPRPPRLGPASPARIRTRTRNAITGAADDDRHAGHQNALSQHFRILTRPCQVREYASKWFALDEEAHPGRR